MKLALFTCDGCMATKPEKATGWWAIEIAVHGGVPQMSIAPALKNVDSTGHACSQDCAMKLASTFVATAKIDKGKRKAALESSRLSAAGLFSRMWGMPEPPPTQQEEDDDE